MTLFLRLRQKTPNPPFSVFQFFSFSPSAMNKLSPSQQRERSSTVRTCVSPLCADILKSMLPHAQVTDDGILHFELVNNTFKYE